MRLRIAFHSFHTVVIRRGGDRHPHTIWSTAEIASQFRGSSVASLWTWRRALGIIAKILRSQWSVYLSTPRRTHDVYRRLTVPVSICLPAYIHVQMGRTEAASWRHCRGGMLASCLSVTHSVFAVGPKRTSPKQSLPSPDRSSMGALNYNAALLHSASRALLFALLAWDRL